MKRIIASTVLALCIGVGAAIAANQCNFDLDCGWNMKCVGSFGNKVCMPK
jgi:hypothetical protein